jgi:hypothetical protein
MDHAKITFTELTLLSDVYSTSTIQEIYVQVLCEISEPCAM